MLEAGCQLEFLCGPGPYFVFFLLDLKLLLLFTLSSWSWVRVVCCPIVYALKMFH